MVDVPCQMVIFKWGQFTRHVVLWEMRGKKDICWDDLSLKVFDLYERVGLKILNTLHEWGSKIITGSSSYPLVMKHGHGIRIRNIHDLNLNPFTHILHVWYICLPLGDF